MVVFSSCKADPVGTSVASQKELRSEQPLTITETPPHLPSATPSLLPSATSTAEIKFTKVPLQTPGASPTSPVVSPTIPYVFRICSPVATLSLNDLSPFISSPYHVGRGGKNYHEGMDITYYQLNGVKDSILGVSIQAGLAGRVAAAISGSYPYGNFVIIETRRESLPTDLTKKLKITEGKSLYLLYAHMQDTPLVGLSEDVSACQSIGKVGNSGNTDAPHLHLEARIGRSNVTFDVLSALVDGVTPEERANYVLWHSGAEFKDFDPMLLLTYIP